LLLLLLLFDQSINQSLFIEGKQLIATKQEIICYTTLTNQLVAS